MMRQAGPQSFQFTQRMREARDAVQLLQEIVRVSREWGGQVLIEVHPSNNVCIAHLCAFRFEQIDRRQGYYPASGRREDAIL